MSQRKSFTHRELIRALERNGFERLPTKRGKGDHVLLAHPDGRRTTVSGPGKSVVGKGLMSAILRQTGLTHEDLRK
jgi:predicted RNA binding protein YcfA (HicA-like mRNA interferase family)